MNNKNIARAQGVAGWKGNEARRCADRACRRVEDRTEENGHFTWLCRELRVERGQGTGTAGDNEISTVSRWASRSGEMSGGWSGEGGGQMSSSRKSGKVDGCVCL